MYGIDMYYTVKTLLDKGKSLREISRILGINRKTVTKIRDQTGTGTIKIPKQNRSKKLDDFEEIISGFIEKGFTAKIMHNILREKHGLKIGYSTLAEYVSKLKPKEVYVPYNTAPGEEAQVDFGYFGKFDKDGKSVKVWVFSMILSYSRYAYYQLVTDQKTETFINCHINAFEYFSGVPETVLIDNLKAAVLSANFYEPALQQNYSEFLSHYKSAPLTARVRRGQDKGKVESGIKYVKNNFLKTVQHSDFYKLKDELEDWNNDICNKRIHGTTRLIPENVFENEEKNILIPLPQKRFEVFKIQHRKVKPNAHISFELNYYSVPFTYAGQEITTKSNGKILKIYKDLELLCVHEISRLEGKYITKEDHKPPYKQRKSETFYKEKADKIGENVFLFLVKLQKEKPHHWHRLISGIFSLRKIYSNPIIDAACKRACDFNALSYKSVKNICETGLYKSDYEVNQNIENAQGFNQELSKYDKLQQS
jgi:transposase